MEKSGNRRQFLKTGAASVTAAVSATAAATTVGFWVAGGSSTALGKSPNEQIQFACIGVGGKGTSDLADAAKHGKIMGLCDIDGRTLAKAAAGHPEAKKYYDFRTMLDELGNTIDAVTVSTPDHNHAAAALMAMRMGKHCFCQKPLTRTIYEARLMGQVAAENNLVTQMGNQGTAIPGLRQAAATVRSGILGNVSEVHVWTDRPVWPQGITRPTENPPVPSHVHWDEWLGVAPVRPYNPGYHPFKWRGWWDFGSGALGDMACHTFNMPYAALDLRDPISVEADSSGHNKDTFPGWSDITFQFPQRGNRGPVKVKWYDGGKKPELDVLNDRDVREFAVKMRGEKNAMISGAVMIGDEATLFAPADYAEDWMLVGKEKPTSIDFKTSPGHFTEFAHGVAGGETPMSNFPNYAGPLTETILLGNLAVWSGQKIEWDAKSMTATNNDDPGVAALIKPTYRDGYTLDV